MKKLRFSVAPQFQRGNVGIIIDNPLQEKHLGLEGEDGNNPPFSSIILDEDNLKIISKYLQDYLEEECEK